VVEVGITVSCDDGREYREAREGDGAWRREGEDGAIVKYAGPQSATSAYTDCSQKTMNIGAVCKLVKDRGSGGDF
jgi:hypothetical protein